MRTRDFKAAPARSVRNVVERENVVVGTGIDSKARDRIVEDCVEGQVVAEGTGKVKSSDEVV